MTDYHDSRRFFLISVNHDHLRHLCSIKNLKSFSLGFHHILTLPLILCYKPFLSFPFTYSSHWGRIVFTLNGFGSEYAIFSVIGGEEMKLAIGNKNKRALTLKTRYR
ncbi:MAG: hypothetical protein DRR16_20445 [Candidatus Parabeggiatoa sp. nov. 3]|nr:MAG: hypothetical protein DRR00_05785 [Gammaproteobacteria bacterium]RKZ82123.1 MAG: hypothetical protein DRR16_20445 [Gammaproteobacteria bacterium]